MYFDLCSIQPGGLLLLQKTGSYLLFIGLVLFSACSQTNTRTALPAFYYWKTTLALLPSERAYLDSLSCKKVYVKVLDIGRDQGTGKIVPLSRLNLTDTTGLTGLRLVPTVFITNEVFKGISEEELEELVKRLNSAPDPKGEGIAAPRSFRGGVETGEAELQFDCDWTPSTRAVYFSFLQKIKKQLPSGIHLSATIRLHQYKFPKTTGVPPVERGMLMFYNTGDIDDLGEVNSIFQPEAARKYLKGTPAHYPLPLDLALPLFSWTLVFRDEALWKIIPEFPHDDLRDTTRFEPLTKGTMPFSSSHWKVRKGTFVSGHYLRLGDLLRRESISPELLLQAAQLAADMDLADDATVAFFHLDSAIIRRYPVQLIDSVWQTIQFGSRKK